MNSIYKILLTGLLSFSMLTVMAQGPRHEGPHHEPDVTEAAPHEGCPMHNMVPAVDFQSVKICYAPQLGAFVAIDSVECSVHLVAMKDGQLDTVGVFVTDNTHKRHDLKNILRPISVTAMGEYIVVLASAKSDSAYVTILDKEMKPLAKRCFSSPMYAMHREHGMLMIAGRNPYGYDINILPLHGMNFEAFENGEILSHHYRVAKQAEKIKQSDPVGIGLTAVAVAVVFLALVCISLILQGSGKLMRGVNDKRKEDKPKERAIKPVSDGSSSEDELIAAIAAAIHLYNEELHDEEDTVITIQKVEREWTPWNAKYYNMNQYFNNRK